MELAIFRLARRWMLMTSRSKQDRASERTVRPVVGYKARGTKRPRVNWRNRG